MSLASIALDFDVTDFFVFGSALGNVLAYRKIRVNFKTVVYLQILRVLNNLDVVLHLKMLIALNFTILIYVASVIGATSWKF